MTEKKSIGSQSSEMDNINSYCDVIIENSAAIVYVKDIEGRYLFVNPRWEDATGISKEAAIGNKAVDVFSKPVGEQFQNNEAEVIKTGKLMNFEEIVQSGNSLRYFDTAIIPFKDESGRITGICAMSSEITEQKIAQNALMKRLSYENLLSNISVMAVTVYDLDDFLDRALTEIGETFNVSRAYIFEHDKENDVMDNTFEWCSPGIYPHIEELQGLPAADFKWWSDTLMKGDVICFNDIEDIPDETAKETLRPQGILSLLVVPLFVNGEYYGFIGFDDCHEHRVWEKEDIELLLAMSRILVNVMERKMVEDELQLKSLVLDQITDLVTVTDLEGNITYVNEAETKILKIPKEEMIGRPVSSYGENPEKGATQQEIIEETKKNGSWRGEVINYSADGREIVMDCRTRVVLDERGDTVALCGVSTDITERKLAEAEKEKLQKQLAQAQKMESIGRLAGGIAHDFNNMLSVISGRVELALMKSDADSSLHSDLEEIREAAERSALLTAQLLAFARKQVISPKIININEAIGNMTVMLRRLIGENIELNWNPGKDISNIMIDPAQVDQVITNLCVNSKDAISEHGTITIKTKNCTVNEPDLNLPGLVPGDYVKVSVQDDGQGMDADTATQIFEPFFTTKELGKGTGLGLATVFGIVKQNQGYIYCNSTPGAGTCFDIYFPKKDGTNEIAVKEKQTFKKEQTGDFTILLVEDEPAILDMAKDMLESFGYKVISSGSPQQALKKSLEHKGSIDLLMTDVVMPEMNGRELAVKIISQHPLIKCLFMSGYTAEVIAHESIIDEDMNFLKKPFSMSQLREKLEKIMGEK